MIYKITNLKDKIWQGKNFKEADLIDSNGELFKISAWAGEFDNRSEIDVELEKNDKGYWRIKKTQTPRGSAFSAHREAVIEKAVARKEEGIARSQDNKDWSIRTSSTMNHAVDLAIAEYTINKQSLDRLDECVLKWRKFLWNNWEVELKDTDPTTDKIL